VGPEGLGGVRVLRVVGAVRGDDYVRPPRPAEALDELVLEHHRPDLRVGPPDGEVPHLEDARADAAAIAVAVAGTAGPEQHRVQEALQAGRPGAVELRPHVPPGRSHRVAVAPDPLRDAPPQDEDPHRAVLVGRVLEAALDQLQDPPHRSRRGGVSPRPPEPLGGVEPVQVAHPPPKIRRVGELGGVVARVQHVLAHPPPRPAAAAGRRRRIEQRPLEQRAAGPALVRLAPPPISPDAGTRRRGKRGGAFAPASFAAGRRRGPSSRRGRRARRGPGRRAAAADPDRRDRVAQGEGRQQGEQDQDGGGGGSGRDPPTRQARGHFRFRFFCSPFPAEMPPPRSPARELPDARALLRGLPPPGLSALAPPARRELLLCLGAAAPRTRPPPRPSLRLLAARGSCRPPPGPFFFAGRQACPPRKKPLAASRPGDARRGLFLCCWALPPRPQRGEPTRRGLLSVGSRRGGAARATDSHWPLYSRGGCSSAYGKNEYGTDAGAVLFTLSSVQFIALSLDSCARRRTSPTASRFLESQGSRLPPPVARTADPWPTAAAERGAHCQS
jgi:hypothetical protein